MKKTANGNNLGFTLIEVLIALVVIAIGFTAVMMTLRQTLLVQQKLPDKVISQMIAMNALTEMQLKLVAVPSSTPQVENIAMAHAQWKWQANLLDVAKGMGYVSIVVSKQEPAGYIRQDVLYGYVREGKHE